MLRGTRILIGKDVDDYVSLIDKFRVIALNHGFLEVMIPSIWEQKTFTDKAGSEVLNQMYTFKDKGNRDICLIPEVTAIIQEQYKTHWSKSMPKPVKVFYVSKCYRYDRPQEGRYREFTQFGVEILGGDSVKDRTRLLHMLKFLLRVSAAQFNIIDSVKRGLDYYVEDGFEAECPILGAQKQVAGGGRYDCGVGFAIGIDRLLLAIQKE